MKANRVTVFCSLFIANIITTSTTTSNKMNATNGEVDRSVHSASIDEVHEVPMSVIHRPIPSVLDEEKVKSLMETIKASLFILNANTI